MNNNNTAPLGSAAAEQAAVPAGYALVPPEPTAAMMDAAEACSNDWPRTTWAKAYAAMLAAAPAVPSPPLSEGLTDEKPKGMPRKQVDILEVANERRFMALSDWYGIWDKAPVQGEVVLATDGDTVIMARWFASGWAKYDHFSDDVEYLPEGWVTHWKPFDQSTPRPENEGGKNGLTDERIDHIARQYFAEAHDQEAAHNAIYDALQEVARLSAPPSPTLHGAVGAETKTWPERIWLQHGCDEVPDYADTRGVNDGITWCEDNINEHDVEYMRADLATPVATQSGAAAAPVDRNAVLEEAAQAAEKIEDDYRDSQGGKWPELRDDAATGAGDCASAIRALKTVSAPDAAAAPRQDAQKAIECWSHNEEDFNAQSLGELLDCHDLKPGDTVWVGEAVHPDPSELVSVDWIIENMGEAAYDIAGEHAEDYPEVTEAEGKELEALIAGWIAKHCPPTFYTVKNIKARTLTPEDFPSDSSPVSAPDGGDARKETGE